MVARLCISPAIDWRPGMVLCTVYHIWCKRTLRHSQNHQDALWRYAKYLFLTIFITITQRIYHFLSFTLVLFLMLYCCWLCSKHFVYWENMMLSGRSPVHGTSFVKWTTLHPLARVGWSRGWPGELRVHYSLLIKAIDLFLWLLAKPTRTSSAFPSCTASFRVEYIIQEVDVPLWFVYFVSGVMPVGEWLIGYEWIKTELHFDLLGIFDTRLPDLGFCLSRFSQQFDDNVFPRKRNF